MGIGECHIHDRAGGVVSDTNREAELARRTNGCEPPLIGRAESLGGLGPAFGILCGTSSDGKSNLGVFRGNFIA